MDSEGLRRSRTLLRNVLPLTGRAQRAVGGIVALATGSVLAAAAHAQTATACATASCELAQQTALTTLLQPFTTLPGTAAWTANYEVQQSIYLNSTYAQRVQSAQNSALANAQNLIWPRHLARTASRGLLPSTLSDIAPLGGLDTSRGLSPTGRSGTSANVLTVACAQRAVFDALGEASLSG